MIVLDSTVLIAAISAKDRNCARAKGLLAEVDGGRWGQALIPDWVLVEVLNFVGRRLGRAAAERAARTLFDPKTARILACSQHAARARDLFLSRAGQQLSFADAGIVAAAQSIGARYLATYDTGFRSIPGLRIVEGPGAAP